MTRASIAVALLWLLATGYQISARSGPTITAVASQPESADTLSRQVDDRAFVKPVRHQVPAMANAAWSRNPIDGFLLSAMSARGLTPAPAADRRTLVRRAYLDVLGLPPTPAEVEVHATILHLLGLDFEKLTYRFDGRDMRLTDVHGRVIKEILA